MQVNVQLHATAALLPRKEPRNPLDRRLGESQSRLGRYGKQKKPALSGIETRSSCTEPLYLLSYADYSWKLYLRAFVQLLDVKIRHRLPIILYFSMKRSIFSVSRLITPVINPRVLEPYKLTKQTENVLLINQGRFVWNEYGLFHVATVSVIYYRS